MESSNGSIVSNNSGYILTKANEYFRLTLSKRVTANGVIDRSIGTDTSYLLYYSPFVYRKIVDDGWERKQLSTQPWTQIASPELPISNTYTLSVSLSSLKSFTIDEDPRVVISTGSKNELVSMTTVSNNIPTTFSFQSNSENWRTSTNNKTTVMLINGTPTRRIRLHEIVVNGIPYASNVANGLVLDDKQFVARTF